MLFRKIKVLGYTVLLKENKYKKVFNKTPIYLRELTIYIREYIFLNSVNLLVNNDCRKLDFNKVIILSAKRTFLFSAKKNQG